MASKPKRKRNYALEYLIRKARGLEDGRSLAQARGHARAVDLPSGTTPHPFKRSEPLENGLKLMKQGVSQKEAAKQVGVSPETLRRFQKGQHDFPQGRPPLDHRGHASRVGRHGEAPLAAVGTDPLHRRQARD
jgi:hypothetical protein